MSFSPSIGEKALVDSGRFCCLCHKFCGNKIELHHIKPKADGGLDTYENCIPLCFDCHAEVGAYNIKHPKGRKFTESELISHRDRWYEKQQSNIQDIAQIPEYKKLDTEVLREIKCLLGESGTINFLREKNFAGFAFDMRYIDPLEEIKYLVNNKPEFEFLDIDLEVLKEELCSNINKLTSILQVNTWPIDVKPNFNSVPKEWEYEQPERFWKVVNEIHLLTTAITDNYDELIRLSRRKLII